MPNPKLEQEFEELKKNIKEHVQQAVKSINAANKLCKKKTGKSLAGCVGCDYDYDDDGYPENLSDEDQEKLENLMDDMYGTVQPLLSALDKAGWNTSSLGC